MISRFKFYISALIFLISLSSMMCYFSCSSQKTRPQETTTEKVIEQKSETSEKVKVRLYVMSMCPFGAMAQKNMAQIIDEMGAFIDFKQEIIASEREPGEFSSLHGPDEISGDIIQLCAQKYYGKNYQFMDFVVCMAENYKKIPSNWEECAKVTNLDSSLISSCFTGEEGKELLMESADTASSKNIMGSPTFIIGNENRITGLRSVNELEIMICCSFSSDKIPDICKTLVNNCPGKNPINSIILTDSRCGECKKFIENGTEKLKELFPKIEFVTEDYSTEKGKQLYEKAFKGYLPAFFLPASISSELQFQEISDYLIQSGEYFVLKVQAGGFDPRKEICSNNTDDNNNGLIDCDDDDCKLTMDCRKEIPALLELFVMSRCPFGIKAEKVVREVIKNFGNTLKFQIHFIVDVYTPEEFKGLTYEMRKGCQKMSDGNYYCSLHGEPELRENLVQSCVQKYYGKNFKFMDFVGCRNENIYDPHWESCAVTNKIDIEKISACAEGSEGIETLKQDAILSNSLGINASPTFIGNGIKTLEIYNYTSHSITEEICKLNPKLKICKNIDTLKNRESENKDEKEEVTKCGE